MFEQFCTQVLSISLMRYRIKKEYFFTQIETNILNEKRGLTNQLKSFALILIMYVQNRMLYTKNEWIDRCRY